MSKIAIALLGDLEPALRSEDLVDQNFNMTTWCDLHGIPLSNINQNLCGFSACAAGLGCTLPSWKERGFYITSFSKNYPGILTIGYDDFEGTEALARGLELGLGFTELIFMPEFYFNHGMWGAELDEEEIKLLPDDDPYHIRSLEEIDDETKIKPYMVANRIKNVIKELKNGT